MIENRNWEARFTGRWGNLSNRIWTYIMAEGRVKCPE